MAQAQPPASPSAESPPAEGASALPLIGPLSPERAAEGGTAAQGQPPAKSANLIDLAHPDLIYLESAAKPGEYLPVPQNATFEEFQEFLRNRRRATTAPERPPYYITALALDGVVRDDHAEFTAQLDVQVNRSDQDVLVPLQFNEATLRDTRYDGPGMATPDDRDRELSHRWWFRGEGIHRLNLTFSLELRRQVPGHRLQLSLPATAVSSLKLRIPEARIQVRPGSAGPRPEVRSISGDASEITLYGLGSRLDLSWLPVPEQETVETQLQSTTFITVQLTPDEVVLDAVQAVQALQGSFQRLTIRLPEHFRLQKVDRGDFEVQTNEKLAHVIFSEPTTGPILLKWVLNAEYDSSENLPQENRWIRIDGFDILQNGGGRGDDYQVRQQSGYIAVDAGEDFLVSKRDGDSSSVLRRSVSSLGKNREFRAAVTEGRISSAYQFLKQPFFLALDLKRVEPYFTADPQYILLLTESRAELEANVRLQINRGTVSEVALNWPGFAAEHWKLEPASSPVQVTASDEGLVLENLPLPDGDGWVQCRFRASRELLDGDSGLHNLTLPRVKATTVLPPTLVVADAENVKSSLVAVSDSKMKSIPLEEISVPAEIRLLSRVSAYRIDDPKEQNVVLSGRVEAKEQEVSVESVLDLQIDKSDPGGPQLRVTQTLNYAVQYQRLSQARLLIPQLLTKLVEFRNEDGGQAIPVYSGQESDEVVSARIPFELPRIGRFSLKAEYKLPLPDTITAERQRFEVPLLRSQDHVFRQIELRWTPQIEVAVSPEDPFWVPEPQTSRVQIWRSIQSPAVIPLELQPSDQAHDRTFRVARAYLRTELSPGGRILTVAQYRIEGDVPVLNVRLPIGLTATRKFYWNDQQLDSEQVVTASSGGGEYRLDLSAFDSAEGGLLTVEYSMQTGRDLGWSDQHRLAAPRFDERVHVGQTVWEICLPTGQYLFESPRQVSPEFAWERNLVFWRRTATGPLANPEQWIRHDDGPDGLPGSDRTNDYPFSVYGDVAAITFRSISLPMMVLLGAGTALLAGFLLLMIPAARSMLTILAVGFLVAVVGLWYAEAVQLLLQWAILGLVLAAAAAYIDATVKTPRGTGMMTLSSPSDFLPPSSSAERPVAISLGSDDPTAHRPRHDSGFEALSASDSGRRQ